MNAKEKFEEQAYFNKWLKELTEDERDHVIDMMESYHQAKIKEGGCCSLCAIEQQCAEERYEIAVKHYMGKHGGPPSMTIIESLRYAAWGTFVFGKEGEG